MAETGERRVINLQATTFEGGNSALEAIFGDTHYGLHGGTAEKL